MIRGMHLLMRVASAFACPAACAGREQIQRSSSSTFYLAAQGPMAPCVLKGIRSFCSRACTSSNVIRTGAFGHRCAPCPSTSRKRAGGRIDKITMSMEKFTVPFLIFVSVENPPLTCKTLQLSFQTLLCEWEQQSKFTNSLQHLFGI